MKRNLLSIIILSLAFVFSSGIKAQVAINTDGSAPNGSAMLDITSSDKGILIPRVASTGDVTSPATGLLVYQSSDDAFYYYDGGQWIKLGSQWGTNGSNLYYTNGVSIGGAVVDPSAILDIQSDVSGILVPRLTESAKNSIVSPALGLLIYQTDGSPGFYYYDGSQWNTVAGLLSLDVSSPLTSTGGSTPLIGLTSPIAVANGGTGAVTFTANGILYGSGTSPITSVSTFVRTATGVGVGTANPNSSLHVSGSFATAYVAKVSNYSLTINDHIIAASGAATTITLPTAVGITGRIYTIKDVGGSAVTIATTSGQTIDGAASYSLSATNKYVTVVSNGANWLIIGNN